MEDYTVHAIAAVEKRLNILATVAMSAPLLGMTGTVTGMIASFGQIQEAGGLDATKVAGGISEALITTATGLIVALIATIPYYYFSSRADGVALEIEEATTEIVDFLATSAEPVSGEFGPDAATRGG
jgi:biopolymer transport protein ExbB